MENEIVFDTGFYHAKGGIRDGTEREETTRDGVAHLPGKQLENGGRFARIELRQGER